MNLLNHGLLRTLPYSVLVAGALLPLVMSGCGPTSDRDTQASDSFDEIATHPETRMQTIRAFLRGTVAPELPEQGEWDSQAADALQQAIYAHQIHEVWGTGSEALPGHKPGLYTPNLGAHIRFQMDRHPKAEGLDELRAFLDALDALGVGLTGLDMMDDYGSELEFDAGEK
jgi:hypothetical protein